MFFESVGILRHFINFNLCPARAGLFFGLLHIKSHHKNVVAHFNLPLILQTLVLPFVWVKHDARMCQLGVHIIDIDIGRDLIVVGCEDGNVVWIGIAVYESIFRI